VFGANKGNMAEKVNMRWLTCYDAFDIVDSLVDSFVHFAGPFKCMYDALDAE
jgi:hypothetical protein